MKDIFDQDGTISNEIVEHVTKMTMRETAQNAFLHRNGLSGHKALEALPEMDRERLMEEWKTSPERYLLERDVEGLTVH